MEYELRTLCSKDIFPMVKIVSCIGLKEFKTAFESEDIKRMANQAQNGAELNYSVAGLSVVFDVAGIILANIPKCENEIFDFLTSVSNLSRKQVEAMPLADFAQMIIDLFRKPEFKDFIGVVSRFAGTAN